MRQRPDIAAAVVTVVMAVLLCLLLVSSRLTFDPEGYPPVPRPTTELAEVDEEFVDLFDPKTLPANPQSAYTPAESDNNSTPAEADGSDLSNAGEAAAPAPVVTTERQSPVQKPKKEKPEKTGPSKKELEEEKARREARSGVSNAFKPAPEATDNTESKGADKGDSGKPDGAASDLNGTGHGSVGGGWIMPSYAKVRAYQTGSIELRAIVGRDGKVKSVELTGGKAPASGDPALVSKCIAEVRRHRFTRTDDNAPESATARIVYTFK